MKKMTIQKTKPVLVFDVNETLLDMTPLKKSVNALLDNEQGSASGLAHYYTTPLYRIVSTSIMTLVLLPTLAMAATSMNRK
jgi:2-haloacid dehalogenase